MGFIPSTTMKIEEQLDVLQHEYMPMYIDRIIRIYKAYDTANETGMMPLDGLLNLPSFEHFLLSKPKDIFIGSRPFTEITYKEGYKFIFPKTKIFDL